MATKTIQDANGDIFDCVDFRLQPTFQDPLFKNHTVQISPSSYPSSGNLSSNNVSLQSEIEMIGCPIGTIPIWRNYRKPLPLTSIKLLTSELMEGENSKNINVQDAHFATIVNMNRRVFGARASTSVYEPHVEVGKPVRHSGSASMLVNGPSIEDLDFMTAGWFVWPAYSGDNHVRLFSYWDSKTGNWWLTFGENNKPIGYWEKSIFNYMNNGAGKVIWGGLLQGLRDEPSPPMGSGHFPSEGFGKAAFYQDVKVIYDGQNLVVPKTTECFQNYDRPDCYKVSIPQKNDNGIGFYFGGPAGCKH